MTKRILSLLLAALTVLSLCVPALAAETEAPDLPETAASIAYSGTLDGSNIKWTMSTDGTLTFTGKGRMVPYWGDMIPWGQLFHPNAVPTKKIVLGEGITNVCADLYWGCKTYFSISIPTTVSTIDADALTGNYYHFVQDITVAPGSKYFTTVNGVLFDAAKKTLVRYPSGKAAASYSIPSGVTAIGAGAFIFSTNLTSVTIPNTVKTIGGDAFSCCSSSLTIRGYDGSAAQTYARKNGIKFVSLGTAPAAKKGWVTEGGKKYYYQNGEKLKGLYLIGGQRYYFSAKDGAMLTGIVTVDNAGHKCYFSAKDGHRITGVVTVDSAGHKCYFSAKTGYQLKGLVTTDAKGTQRYFSAKTGYMLKNGWYNIGNGKKALINASGVVTKITKI